MKKKLTKFELIVLPLQVLIAVTAVAYIIYSIGGANTINLTAEQKRSAPYFVGESRVMNTRTGNWVQVADTIFIGEVMWFKDVQYDTYRKVIIDETYIKLLGEDEESAYDYALRKGRLNAAPTKE